MHGAIQPADSDRELILVLLKNGDQAQRHARVADLLRRLGATIEVDFGKGWLAGATTNTASVVAAHRDVKVAGGVYRSTEGALPRRIRRQVDD